MKPNLTIDRWELRRPDWVHRELLSCLIRDELTNILKVRRSNRLRSMLQCESFKHYKYIIKISHRPTTEID